MIDDELELLCSLFAWQREIERVILYGSRARGTHKPFSDVDITLLEVGLTRSHLNRLMADIDESSLPYSFDISIFSKLTNPDLVEQIERTGVVLYQRGENAIVAERWFFSFFPSLIFLFSKNFFKFVEIPVREYIYCKCERLKILSYIGILDKFFGNG